MSSIGSCFDIGMATCDSLNTFERRQNRFAKEHNIPPEQMDYFSNEKLLNKFHIYCSEDEVAGNGALMRLAPVPLFFYRYPQHAVEYSGRSGQITHGDKDAYNACRYYGALIVAALHGYKKDQLLDRNFYSKHTIWFNEKRLYNGIKAIAEGSYQRPGGYIVDALEAALWAFWSDGDSFEKGALEAVNLGDDTDTTAAIYGQLAGAYYG
jgi:ADP-ribosylglycohydrolase